MPINVRYQCLNCGNEFQVGVLTDDERREAEKRNERVFAIQCPKCNRRDVRNVSN